MKYSKLTERIASEGAAAWDIHYRALEKAAAGEDVIVLSVGDPDLDTPAPIRDAAISGLSDGQTHYTDCQGEADLRGVIAAWETSRRANGVAAQQIVVQAGAQCGLYSLAQCLLELDDEVIVFEPMYITYEAVFTSVGAKLKKLNLDPENDWALPLEHLQRAINSRTRAIVLNTPNNPTGAMLNNTEWQAVLELAHRHDLWVIVDEVYSELTYDQPHLDLTHPLVDERVVTINSLSKSHAMTGWRVGWITASESLAEHLTNLALCMLYGLPKFVQSAAIEAFVNHPSYVSEARSIYLRRRNAAVSVLTENGVPLSFVPNAGMFLMLDVRGTGLSATEFAEQLLDRYGVSVLVGDAFGEPARGHIRISFCLNEARIREAMSRIAKFWNELLH